MKRRGDVFELLIVIAILFFGAAWILGIDIDILSERINREINGTTAVPDCICPEQVIVPESKPYIEEVILEASQPVYDDPYGTGY